MSATNQLIYAVLEIDSKDDAHLIKGSGAGGRTGVHLVRDGVLDYHVALEMIRENGKTFPGQVTVGYRHQPEPGDFRLDVNVTIPIVGRINVLYAEFPKDTKEDVKRLSGTEVPVTLRLYRGDVAPETAGDEEIAELLDVLPVKTFEEVAESNSGTEPLGAQGDVTVVKPTKPGRGAKNKPEDEDSKETKGTVSEETKAKIDGEDEKKGTAPTIDDEDDDI